MNHEVRSGRNGLRSCGLRRWGAGPAALILVLMARCAGPQPLPVAIDPQDEATYVRFLNTVNGDGRTAFAQWMAEERGASPQDILAADAGMDSTANPFDAYTDPRSVSRGAVIYHVHCARCHGDDARGRGPAILATHPAGDFRTIGKRFASTLHRGAPRKWFGIITDGRGDPVDYPDGRSMAMPPFGDKLMREQVWLVITYLQSLEVHAVARGSSS